MEYRNLELRGIDATDGMAPAPCQVASRPTPWRAAIAVCFALMLALGFAPPEVLADDLDDLKDAVETAQTELAKAERAEKAVLKEIEANNADQKKAADAGKKDEEKRLKSKGVELKSSLNSATKKREEAAQKLAGKQSDLRKEASKVAEEQINAKDDANARTKRAGEAIEVWKAALGGLLSPPEIRKCDDLDDEEIRAQKQDDKQRLKDFISWADSEKSNVETEIKRAEALVKGEDKFKGADGQARLLNDCKQLKSDLESRKSSIEKSIKAAHSSLKTLEK